MRVLGQEFFIPPRRKHPHREQLQIQPRALHRAGPRFGLDAAGILDRCGRHVFGSRAGGLGLSSSAVSDAPDRSEIDSQTATTIMIAVVRIDSISGDSAPANQAKHAERDDADAVRQLQEAAKGVLEQDRPDQKQQGTADRAQHRLGSE